MTTSTQDLHPPSSNTDNRSLELSSTVTSQKDEAKLVQWVQGQYKRMKDARGPVERQWYLNMAFFYGRQNVQWISSATSVSGYKLYTPPAPPWRVRLVINKVRSIIRTELAKVTSQKPMFTVVPATSEEEDYIAAKAAEQIFKSLYQTKKLQRVIKQAEWWTLVCGVGFIKCFWDRDALDELNNAQGDIQYEAITPFHILVPDLREQDIEQQPYIIHAQTKTVDWVKARYHRTISGKKIEPNTTSSSEIIEDAFLNMIGAKSNINDEVLVLEVWIKPGGHPDFPRGGLITVVGDQIAQVWGAVEDQSYPYSHGKYPFAKLEHIPSGKFYSTSVIEDVIPIQREYNRTRSQIVESKNRMTRPQLLAQEGSVDAKKITSEPGQVITYKPGYQPPTPLPLQNLPAYVFQSLELLQTDLDDISSQHEITRGQTPPQVTAATAISYLQEQDDSKLSHTIETLEDGVEKIGKLTLSYVSDYWTTERLVTVMGRDGAFEAERYKGADLKGYNDVRVEAGSALATSKAAKQAFIMDLMKNQLIPADKGLEILDLAGIDRLYEDLQMDIRQAQRENLRMADGANVPPNTWDNHGIHIDRHNQFRKSEQFEQLDDATKAIFEQHVLTHQLQQRNEMMQQMMMSQNGNAGAGQPAPGMLGPGQQPGGIQ